MLESMCTNPRPTRAEASDVANAVLDGTDCVMLSGETAGGSYPLEAVDVMSRICSEAERCLDYQAMYQRLRRTAPKPLPPTEAVCSAAVRTALDMEVKLIVVITDTGTTAALVSKYRPKSNILVVSMNQSTILQTNVHYGCLALKVPSYEGTDNVLRFAIDVARNTYNLVDDDDTVICLHGQNEDDVNQANIMKILNVNEITG
jgi:pyruvate kinase